jgi:hypothetical protein
MPGPHSSYQGATNGAKEGSRLLPIMPSLSDMERRKRSRLCVTLALFSTFLALIAAVAVSRVHHVKVLMAPQVASKQAVAALNTLNSRLHDQSKLMKFKCESTIMLTRHCEKVGPNVFDGDGNEHCSYLGLERASFFATLFGDTKKNDMARP